MPASLEPQRSNRADCRGRFQQSPNYDQTNVGWKTTELFEKPSGLTPAEERSIYDTTQIGRGNAGHAYGDHISAPNRRSLIEYLKSLWGTQPLRTTESIGGQER